MQKISFKKWLEETAGSFSIVSCKDLNNPNFQIWGAMSDLNCKRSSKKHKRLTKRKK
jgi:hypothetical protein